MKRVKWWKPWKLGEEEEEEKTWTSRRENEGGGGCWRRRHRKLAKSESGHGTSLLIWNVNCLRFNLSRE
jgi:hypothetical protein